MKDLQFGVRNGIHIVFASFIRTSEDVLSIRKALGSEGQDIKIISKIETSKGWIILTKSWKSRMVL